MEKVRPFALILGVLIMSILIGYLVFAWTGPTANPLSGNVPPTLIGGGKSQTKEGPLTLSTSTDSIFTLNRVGATNPTYFRLGTDDALVINNSGVDTLTLKNGRVGIGTEPSYKLDVNGDARIATNLEVGTTSISGFGIRAVGSTMGGYLKDSNNFGLACAGWWNYGIFAYSNYSTGRAVYAYQYDSSGYAIYAYGGKNYFSVMLVLEIRHLIIN